MESQNWGCIAGMDDGRGVLRLFLESENRYVVPSYITMAYGDLLVNDVSVYCCKFVAFVSLAYALCCSLWELANALEDIGGEVQLSLLKARRRLTEISSARICTTLRFTSWRRSSTLVLLQLNKSILALVPLLIHELYSL